MRFGGFCEAWIAGVRFLCGFSLEYFEIHGPGINWGRQCGSRKGVCRVECDSFLVFAAEVMAL